MPARPSAEAWKLTPENLPTLQEALVRRRTLTVRCRYVRTGLRADEVAVPKDADNPLRKVVFDVVLDCDDLIARHDYVDACVEAQVRGRLARSGMMKTIGALPCELEVRLAHDARPAGGGMQRLVFVSRGTNHCDRYGRKKFGCRWHTGDLIRYLDSAQSVHRVCVGFWEPAGACPRLAACAACGTWGGAEWRRRWSSRRKNVPAARVEPTPTMSPQRTTRERRRAKRRKTPAPHA